MLIASDSRSKDANIYDSVCCLLLAASLSCVKIHHRLGKPAAVTLQTAIVKYSASSNTMDTATAPDGAMPIQSQGRN